MRKLKKALCESQTERKQSYPSALGFPYVPYVMTRYHNCMWKIFTCNAGLHDLNPKKKKRKMHVISGTVVFSTRYALESPVVLHKNTSKGLHSLPICQISRDEALGHPFNLESRVPRFLYYYFFDNPRISFFYVFSFSMFPTLSMDF